MDVAARQVGPTVAGYTLSLLDGSLKLRTARTGIYPDGWMGAFATYSQYDLPVGQSGQLRIDLSRTRWCGADVRSIATASVGPVAVSRYGEAMIGRVTDTASDVLHSCQTKTLRCSRRLRGPGERR